MQLPVKLLSWTDRLRTRLAVKPIRLSVSVLSWSSVPRVSVAPPSLSTVFATKMPASPLARAMLPVKTPRVERSWAMPQTPLCSAVTRRTVSRSVQEAQTPFFLKPETVSESMRTPSTVLPALPRTQIPLPVFAQASAAFEPGSAGRSTVPLPEPRRVRPGLVTRTLSRYVPGSTTTVSPGRAASTAFWIDWPGRTSCESVAEAEGTDIPHPAAERTATGTRILMLRFLMSRSYGRSPPVAT